MAELPEGTVFAGHRIDGVAGRGGMGVVYRATHLALDHVVALKVIAPELAHDERFRERFKRECRTAVSIHHPNVVPIHHAGEEDGLLFVTMDLISGSDLRMLINAVRGLDPARAAALVRQVAAALDAAHERGLIHRDIKPANVLIERRGEREHVYLTDFGLAKRVVGASEMTAAGSYIGTLEYMAPEQIRGADLDIRTDVYALGGVIFAAVTGRPPFGHIDDDIAKMYAHLNEPPPPVSEVRPGLPSSIDPVVATAMAKDPDARFASAGELAATLDAAVEAGAAESGAPTVLPPDERDVAEQPTEPVKAPTGPTEPLPRTGPSEPSPARRRALGVLGGVAMAALAAGGFLLFGDDDDPGTVGDGQGAPGTVVRDDIPVGEFPVGLAVEGDRVLVAARDGTVTAVDAGTAAAESPTPVGTSIETVAAGFGSVWAADGRDDVVYRLSSDLGSAAPISVGDQPRELLVTDAAVWVTNRDGNSLSRIDPGTSTATEIPVDEFPRALAEGDGALWVASKDGGTIQALDPTDGSELKPSFQLGGEPHGLTVYEGSVWVTDTVGGRLVEVDPDDGTAVDHLGICDEPRDVVAGFGSLWVSCGAGRAVVQVDPATGAEIGRFPFETELELITVGENPDRVWAAGGEGGGLIEIDPTP